MSVKLFLAAGVAALTIPIVLACTGSGGDADAAAPSPDSSSKIVDDKSSESTIPASFTEGSAEVAELEAALSGAASAGKEKFIFAVSIYAGWMPWYYAKESGIIEKWADRYGIEIEVVFMDYIPSVERFVAGGADACVMTNMECLDMPAASGVDCVVIINGDFSNGSDKALARGIKSVKELKGKKIHLVELSVSHYMLVRALEEVGLKERDVKIINASDSDIGPIFLADKNQVAIVTWNPIAMEVQAAEPGVNDLFNSSRIPGEVLDLCVANNKALKRDPNFARALNGAWYEVMGIMTKRGKASKDAKAEMAKLAGCSPQAYQAQLDTTAMFWKAEDAVAYTSDKEIQQNMDRVRNFCFDHGLLGEGVSSVDAVGISYPDGTVQGNKANVKMRFDTTYMKEVADGKITLK